MTPERRMHMTKPDELKPEEVEAFCAAMNVLFSYFDQADATDAEVFAVEEGYGLFPSVQRLLESRAEPRPVVEDWEEWIEKNVCMLSDDDGGGVPAIIEDTLRARLAAQEPSVPVSRLQDFLAQARKIQEDLHPRSRKLGEAFCADLQSLISEATK